MTPAQWPKHIPLFYWLTYSSECLAGVSPICHHLQAAYNHCMEMA